MQRRADGTILLRSPQKLGSTRAASPSGSCNGPTRRRTEPSLPNASVNAGKSSTIANLTARCAASPKRCSIGAWAPSDRWRFCRTTVSTMRCSPSAPCTGIPVAPVSPAYSLMSQDFGKLKYIFELVQPGLVFAADAQKFAPALAAVGAKSTSVAELLETNPGSTQEREHSKVRPESVAKSSSLRARPACRKAWSIRTACCARTSRCSRRPGRSSKRARRGGRLATLESTFGGNHNFNLVLRNGGTMYVDAGKPIPGLVEITARNLKEVAPTLYFNVPRGYDLLLPLLEKDAELRRNFFRPRSPLYAAAALPQNLWDKLQKIAKAEGRPAMLSAWGSTETAPLATSVHFPMQRAGVIGLPVRSASSSSYRRRASSKCACADRTSRPATTAPRPHEARFRRGRLLPHRRCGEAGRCGRSGEGHRVRRTRGRGLQAFHRHLGARWRGARKAHRRRRSAHPGRGDHRPRPLGDRRARFPEPRTKDMSHVALRDRLAAVLRSSRPKAEARWRRAGSS